MLNSLRKVFSNYYRFKHGSDYLLSCFCYWGSSSGIWWMFCVYEIWVIWPLKSHKLYVVCGSCNCWGVWQAWRWSWRMLVTQCSLGAELQLLQHTSKTACLWFHPGYELHMNEFSYFSQLSVNKNKHCLWQLSVSYFILQHCLLHCLYLHFMSNSYISLISPSYHFLGLGLRNRATPFTLQTFSNFTITCTITS